MADNTVADLPTKNAAPAEPAKSLQATVQQVMNKAITSPTDAKVDFAQGVNHITGDPHQKSAGAADSMQTLKAQAEKEDENSQRHGDDPTISKSSQYIEIEQYSVLPLLKRKIRPLLKTRQSTVYIYLWQDFGKDMKP